MERIQIYGGVIVERRKLVQTVSQTETRRDVVINSFLMRRAKEKEKWISRIAVYFSLIRPIDSWHQSTSIIRFYIYIYIYHNRLEKYRRYKSFRRHLSIFSLVIVLISRYLVSTTLASVTNKFRYRKHWRNWINLVEEIFRVKTSVSQIRKGEKLAVLRETIVYLIPRLHEPPVLAVNQRTQMESW